MPPPKNPAETNIELAVALYPGPKLSLMIPVAGGPVEASKPKSTLRAQKA